MTNNTVKIIDLTTSGQGVAKTDGKTIFVDNATIGDEAEIEITKDSKSYSVGKITSLTTPSKNRIEPKCQHFEKCGSCQIQNLNYETQLKFKENSVKQSLQRIGGFKNIKINSIISADEQYSYRNKAQIPIVFDQRIELGYYRPNSHKVEPMKECYLQPADFTTIALELKTFFRKHNLKIYNEKTGKGILRHLVLKKSDYSKEIMIGLVINKKTFPKEKALITKAKKINEHLQKFKITSIVLNINTAKNNVILGKESKAIFGDSYLMEKIGNYLFRVSLNTFLQVNKLQCEKLYKQIAKKIKEDCKLIVDAYCGIGTITLNIADKAKKIIGIESNRRAVKDATKNADINTINNCTFFKNKVEDFDFDDFNSPDVFIIDPPRKGLDNKVIAVIKKLKPKQIFYVSCNPATLARDLKELTTDTKYEIKAVTPYDFFPQTTHVETLVELELC